MFGKQTHWSERSFKQRTGYISGLVALGATMTGVTAVTPIPLFWRGFMTGVWVSLTIAAIVWQVTLQRHERGNRPSA